MRFLIVGAGGFSMEVADLLELLGHEIAGFFDERPKGATHSTTGLSVTDAEPEFGFDAFAIAIGDPAVRERVYARFSAMAPAPTLVHPSASVSAHAVVGDGALIMQNCVVSAASSVGSNTILNVGAYVAHEASVGEHCHIAPTTQVSGVSVVGDRCLLGTGTIVLPGRCIGDDCVIGAGSVVTEDVPSGSVALGVPARVVSDV
jgi:sugar O-acyltransferase (sialic acid O-acetyltransferase NeuD family)